MNYIGVSNSSGELYEGNPSSGFPLSSSSVLLPVRFTNEGANITETLGGYPKHIFKEDFFDPITKIRRGRIFSAEGNQPQDWYVHHPARQDLKEVNCRDGVAQRVGLLTYQKDPLNSLRGIRKFPELIIGREPFTSIWKILSIETSYSGVPLLTLKSFGSFGDVPELIPTAIPENAYKRIASAIEKVENSINRLGPTDVVDRCRDALSIVFGYLINAPEKALAKSINGYVSKFNSNNDNLISWAGKIVARLHSRGKPCEQEKQSVSEISEEDAHLALRCLWLVTVEVGWAQPRPNNF